MEPSRTTYYVIDKKTIQSMFGCFFQLHSGPASEEDMSEVLVEGFREVKKNSISLKIFDDPFGQVVDGGDELGVT